MKKIVRVVLTEEDGTEHVVEKEGLARVRTSTQIDDKERRNPTACLEVSVPLVAEWQSGENGRFIAVPEVSFR